MKTYRARVKAIQRLALDRDLPISGSGIASAVGLPAGTVNAMFAGRAPSSRSMATMAAYFHVSADDLFEIVDEHVTSA